MTQLSWHVCGWACALARAHPLHAGGHSRCEASIQL
nr:MAG TPA: hypothetical protein [Caudoviricetes sp.]